MVGLVWCYPDGTARRTRRRLLLQNFYKTKKRRSQGKKANQTDQTRYDIIRSLYGYMYNNTIIFSGLVMVRIALPQSYKKLYYEEKLGKSEIFGAFRSHNCFLFGINNFLREQFLALEMIRICKFFQGPWGNFLGTLPL